MILQLKSLLIIFFIVNIVDCIVSEWEVWTECSKTCGNGTKARARQVLTPAANDGRKCSSLTESSVCNEISCSSKCFVTKDLKIIQCNIKLIIIQKSNTNH